MRIAIVGSRAFANRKLVVDYVNGLNFDDAVITGGALGVDTWVEAVARRRGLGRIVYEPGANPLLTRAEYTRRLLARNELIVDDSDVVTAFWDGKSNGPMHTVRYAHSVGKMFRVFVEDGSDVTAITVDWLEEYDL